jgi:hypothetical protein
MPRGLPFVALRFVFVEFFILLFLSSQASLCLRVIVVLFTLHCRPRQGRPLVNAPTVPKTDQSFSSLFLEPGFSGFGGMPEQQSIGKNPSPHVIARQGCIKRIILSLRGTSGERTEERGNQ